MSSGKGKKMSFLTVKKVKLRFFVLSLSVLIITGSGCQCPTEGRRGEFATPLLFDQKGALKQEVFDLLRMFNVDHDGTLEGIVNQTQKQWLRQKGKERWEIEDVFADKRESAMPLFEKLQVIHEIKPTKNFYRYALLLGATVSRVRDRLAYLINLWNKGTRFEELVFLCGQRPLAPKLESKDVLFDRTNKNLAIRTDWSPGRVPQTETEMMKMVFDQAELPKEMKDVRVLFVDVPMKKSKDGTLKRPTTPDTIEAWLQMNPEPGNCLASSGQPHIGRQHAVLKTLLPKNFFIETVGPSCNPKVIKIGVLLDMAARWLYQERKRLELIRKFLTSSCDIRQNNRCVVF